jgi:hypothetical protein
VVPFPADAKDFSLLHSVQIGSEAHPYSEPMGTGGLSPAVKRPQREADHPFPSSADVEINETMSPLPVRLLMA